MNIYDKIKKGQEEQAEIIKSVLGETIEDMIEKAKKANIGDIHTWGGKKYKKQANGKWLEVSEHGMTKKEHLKESLKRPYREVFSDRKQRDEGRRKNKEHYSKHFQISTKLSDKEHSDEEVGLGKYKKGDRFEHNGETIYVGHDTSGGQSSITYKAPSVSDKTYWDLDKLKKVIEENKKGNDSKKEIDPEKYYRGRYVIINGKEDRIDRIVKDKIKLFNAGTVSPNDFKFKEESPLDLKDLKMEELLRLIPEKEALMENKGDSLSAVKKEIERRVKAEVEIKVGQKYHSPAPEGGESNDLIQKGKAAVAGEIRTWNGKKYKKQANGKWLEVSESHGLTKKEHENKFEQFSSDKPEDYNKRDLLESGEHYRRASKLSDKEHTDEEVGLGEKDFTTLDRSEKFALLKKAAKGMGKSVYSKSENVFTVGYEDPIVFDLKNKLFWVSPYADNPGEKQLKNFGNLGFKQSSKHTDLPEYVKYQKEIEDDNNKRFGYLNEGLNKESGGEIKKEDIKKSFAAIEIINQNDIIEKSHITNDFAYSDQFSIIKKGKELKQKFAEAILDEVREIKKYITELQALMVEIGELPIVPAGEREYYKVDGYEGKLAEMPNFYNIDGYSFPKDNIDEISKKKIRYNEVAGKVIDCSIEIVLLNTFIKNLDDNKEYKLNATQASKLGF